MTEEKKPTYYELNKERIKQQARDNYAKNREKRIKQMSDLYHKDPKGHREKYKDQIKEYRSRPEIKRRKAETKKAWSLKNKDKIKAHSRKSYLKRKQKKLEEKGLI